MSLRMALFLDCGVAINRDNVHTSRIENFKFIGAFSIYAQRRLTVD